MKQHMLTHKIRDMPQHMFEKPPIKAEDQQQQQPQQQPVPPPLENQPEPEKQAAPSHQPLPESPCDQIPKRAPTEIDMPLPKRPPSK